jgi:hypothetical protein
MESKLHKERAKKRKTTFGLILVHLFSFENLVNEGSMFGSS